MNNPLVIFFKDGHFIKIDGDELPGILASIRKGEPVVTKQTIFNPNYFTRIVEDRERIKYELTPFVDLFKDSR